jgi:hypothetical protein
MAPGRGRGGNVSRTTSVSLNLWTRQAGCEPAKPAGSSCTWAIVRAADAFWRPDHGQGTTRERPGFCRRDAGGEYACNGVSRPGSR